MARRKVVPLCKTSEEVLESKALLDITERVLESIDIYNTRYIIAILNKIRAEEDIILDEYTDLLFVLNDKRFLEKVDKFYDKIDIKGDLRSLTENLQHLKLDKILKNIKEIAKDWLIRNLENRWKVWSRFTFEKTNYILVWEGRDMFACAIIKPLQVDNVKFLTVFFADKSKALVTENGELVTRYDDIGYQDSIYDSKLNKYEMVVVSRREENKIYKWLVTENGLEYGGMKWADIFRYKNMDKWDDSLYVATHDNKVGYVDKKWEDVFAGPNWSKVKDIRDVENYVLVTQKEEFGNREMWTISNEKKWIISKPWKFCFNGPVWDGFKKLVFEGNGLKYGIFKEDDKWGVVGVGWSYVFGWFKWRLIHEVEIVAKWKEYARVVGENRQTCLVDKHGSEVFGGNLIADMDSYEFKVDKHNIVYLQVEKNWKFGLISEDGKEVFGGIVWDEIKDFEYTVDDRTIIAARKESKDSFIHIEHTWHSYPRGKNFG